MYIHYITLPANVFRATHVSHQSLTLLDSFLLAVFRPTVHTPQRSNTKRIRITMPRGIVRAPATTTTKPTPQKKKAPPKKKATPKPSKRGRSAHQTKSPRRILSKSKKKKSTPNSALASKANAKKRPPVMKPHHFRPGTTTKSQHENQQASELAIKIVQSTFALFLHLCVCVQSTNR